MNAFQFIEGKTILNIQRIDNSIDYEYLSPFALIFTLNGLDVKFIISATNDGHSTELKVQTDDEIEEDYGFQFNESYLNNLKDDDLLQSLLTNRIEKLRIAEFIEPEIKGDGFIIRNGTIAGVKLTTN